MYRLIICLAAALPLVLTAACGDNGGGTGPSGSGGEDSLYYPLAVGNTWHYDRSGTYYIDTIPYDISGESTVEIVGTATHSQGWDVFIEVSSVYDTIAGLATSSAVCTVYVWQDEDGIYGCPHLTDTDSCWTVPFPLVEGNTWTFATEPPTTGEILSMDEDVTVPAGTFEECMEMQTIWLEGGNVTNTSDYAREVGMVRDVFTQESSITSTMVDMTLESYQVQ